MILIFLWNSNLYAASLGDQGKNHKYYDTHYSLLSNAPLLNSKSDFQSYPSKALYLNLSPSYSRIYNKSIYNDELWQQKDGGIGYGFEFGYFMKFKKFIGFGIGLGFSSYQTTIGLNSYKDSIPHELDIDEEDYTKIIGVSDLVQKTQLSYIDLPVYLEFGNPNTYKINFYGRIGVKFSYPVFYKFESDGNITTQGIYPQYFVLLYDIKELDFFNNQTIKAAGETKLNPLNISAILSIGMTIPASDRLIFKIGANINYGLMEISADKFSKDDDTKYTGNSNNLLMEPGSNTITQSVGLEIGIIYILQSKF
jgi:hypothetical protein